jgi:hypothetical protein
VVENLLDDDIVAVAAIQNRWTRHRRIELAELANEPWTLPSLDTGIGAFARKRSAGGGPNIVSAAFQIDRNETP